MLPLLLMLVFAIIDFGRMLNAQIKVTEAAREGARLHALGASMSTIENRVEEIMGSPSGLDVDSLPGNCGSNSSPTATARIRVEYTFEFVTPVAALANLTGSSFEVRSMGVMPCQS